MQEWVSDGNRADEENIFLVYSAHVSFVEHEDHTIIIGEENICIDSFFKKPISRDFLDISHEMSVLSNMWCRTQQDIVGSGHIKDNFNPDRDPGNITP